MISGLSANYENLVFLTKLIEHAHLHEKLFTKIPNNKNNQNRFFCSNLPNNLKDDKIEHKDFSCYYVDCIPTISNNENQKENLELFSFENLNLEDLKIICSKNEEEKKNFEKGNLPFTERNQEVIPDEDKDENVVNKKQIVDNELINSIKIIENLVKNKKEIFKEKIRLFPPEIKLRERKYHDMLKINCSSEFLKETEKDHQRKKNEIIEKLKLYEKNMLKVDRKLEKLKVKINKNFEFMDTEDYLKLKKNLILFEKNIDNFIKDFNQLFAGDIKYISNDKFSNLHLFVEEFELKNEKLLNLGKSIEEVFSFISKLIQ